MLVLIGALIGVENGEKSMADNPMSSHRYKIRTETPVT